MNHSIHKCWNCNRDNNQNKFCSHCDVVLNKMNFFEFFDLMVSFTIDLESMGVRYLSLQKVMHPDLFLEENKKKKALTYSSMINQAYKTLCNKLSRAEYILGLRGINLDDERNNIRVDNNILQEIFFLREEIEHSNANRLKMIRDTNSSKMVMIENLIAKNFADDCLDKVIKHVIEYRYLLKINDDIAIKI